jgi:protein-tyrosine phosphatase
VRQLASFLHKNYPDRFMIWNLSEKSYDYSLLDNQVIEFKFPGYPSPPLNQVFSLCNSIHAWLQADEANVAVIHCQTGKGRTLCAIAWYLAWSGQ